jgi:hypothetical protein
MSTSFNQLKNALARLLAAFDRQDAVRQKLYLDGLRKDSIIENLKSQNGQLEQNLQYSQSQLLAAMANDKADKDLIQEQGEKNQQVLADLAIKSEEIARLQSAHESSQSLLNEVKANAEQEAGSIAALAAELENLLGEEKETPAAAVSPAG